MTIITSIATIKDLDTLHSIEKECFTLEAFSREEIAFFLQKPNTISLLAKMEGKIVGYIIALIYEREGKKTGHVLTIDVATKSRKKGVGFRLLKRLERELREKGAEANYLEVQADNVAAQRLYKKLGYLKVGFVKGFYRSGGDCIVMEKGLK
jgi:ribosomal-protein-alanine N-acetyltransferase